MKSLPDYIQFKQFPGTPLADIFTAAMEDLLEFLGKLLTMNPLKRSTATEVSMHLSEQLTTHDNISQGQSTTIVLMPSQSGSVYHLQSPWFCPSNLYVMSSCSACKQLLQNVYFHGALQRSLGWGQQTGQEHCISCLIWSHNTHIKTALDCGRK